MVTVTVTRIAPKKTFSFVYFKDHPVETSGYFRSDTANWELTPSQNKRSHKTETRNRIFRSRPALPAVSLRYLHSVFRCPNKKNVCPEIQFQKRGPNPEADAYTPCFFANINSFEAFPDKSKLLWGPWTLINTDFPDKEEV